jgi:prepilin-type N-terminal cleavage/methylation domain-containing protein
LLIRTESPLLERHHSRGVSGRNFRDSRERSSERGFTLIELAFVSLLLALLSSVIYGSVITMVRTKNALEERRLSERTAQALLTRIGRELENRQSEPLRPVNDEAQRGASSETQADEDGDLEAVTLLLGRSKRSGGVDADSIRFTTLGSAVASDLGNPGLVEVEYRLETLDDRFMNPNTPRTFALVREEVPSAVEDKRVLEERRFRAILSDRVRALQFRYRYNRRWVNQWSAKRETLPDAVEITLSLATESGGSDTYRTAVLLYRQEEG